ncbi:MAG: large-conductance mechanosensitive channel protein MscL [Actinomycetes bacterium]|jgi:large conductance mechanosensitive channel|nr:large-conductance mechanosensitive channel protein MscL [Actinomycetes bacterium]
MKQFIGEFKEFISRGSVIDLAVGIIIGGAFTAIVTSLVNDLVMPFVGWLIGGTDFSGFKLVLHSLRSDGQTATIAWGLFVQNLINFLLVAFVVFLLIKAVNALKRSVQRNCDDNAGESELCAEVAEEVSDEVRLLTEIRDLLNSR